MDTSCNGSRTPGKTANKPHHTSFNAFESPTSHARQHTQHTHVASCVQAVASSLPCEVLVPAPPPTTPISTSRCVAPSNWAATMGFMTSVPAFFFFFRFFFRFLFLFFFFVSSPSSSPSSNEMPPAGSRNTMLRRRLGTGLGGGSSGNCRCLHHLSQKVAHTTTRHTHVHMFTCTPTRTVVRSEHPAPAPAPHQHQHHHQYHRAAATTTTSTTISTTAAAATTTTTTTTNY